VRRSKLPTISAPFERDKKSDETQTTFTRHFTALRRIDLTSAQNAANWQKIFDGKSLIWLEADGRTRRQWLVSGPFEGGALVRQSRSGSQGRTCSAQRKKYSDFEIELEFKADFPVTPALSCARATTGWAIRSRLIIAKDGFIGSLYAPAEGGFIQQNKSWPITSRRDQWNKLRARIEGQPAHVQAWLNGYKTIDFKDSRERFPRERLHLACRCTAGRALGAIRARARFRNIRLWN
jgi:hypothetical protein